MRKEKEMKNIIKIKEEVKIGNVILEEGDRIKIFERQNDWRLPDEEELSLMYWNLHKKGIGNFQDSYYWSSSEIKDNYAWLQNFSNGFQSGNYKVNHFQVRLVRTFIPEIFFEIGEETATGYVFDVQGNTVFLCKKEDERGEMSWDDAMRKFGA